MIIRIESQLLSDHINPQKSLMHLLFYNGEGYEALEPVRKVIESGESGESVVMRCRPKGNGSGQNVDEGKPPDL
jgi:hypothetical protein